MTLNEFLDEYESFNDDRKRQAAQKFFEYIMNDWGFFEYTIKTWMQEVWPEEHDDFFGTEGMDI